ncbi:MAG: methylenetetrahydrofolate reductase, partial [Phenylobacterium sp.]|nr:methylenetetrahydrofolate reductase [Phenylobacterium sp.]
MIDTALGPIARAGAGLAAPPRVSFEFSPPKTEEAEASLWEAIRRLAPLNPAFVSVTYGAGGSTRDRTHRTVTRILAETRLAPAAHLTCVDASRAEVDEVIRDYWDAGVRHIVALRGDPPGQIGGVYVPRDDGYLNATELTAGIRAISPFEVSVSLYPQTHPDSGSVDHDIDVLKAKIDAGATRAITQFFYDVDGFLRFMDRVRKAGVTIPIS